jgi:hypothetical protein
MSNKHEELSHHIERWRRIRQEWAKTLPGMVSRYRQRATDYDLLARNASLPESEETFAELAGVMRRLAERAATDGTR